MDHFLPIFAVKNFCQWIITPHFAAKLSIDRSLLILQLNFPLIIWLHTKDQKACSLLSNALKDPGRKYEGCTNICGEKIQVCYPWGFSALETGA
jgi:hypothetical protein